MKYAIRNVGYFSFLFFCKNFFFSKLNSGSDKKTMKVLALDRRFSFMIAFAKGQTNSKRFFQADVSSKKRNQGILLYYNETSGRLVFFRFMEEIEDTNKTFWNKLTFIKDPITKIASHKYFISYQPPLKIIEDFINSSLVMLVLRIHRIKDSFIPQTTDTIWARTVRCCWDYAILLEQTQV